MTMTMTMTRIFLVVILAVSIAAVNCAGGAEHDAHPSTSKKDLPQTEIQLSTVKSKRTKTDEERDHAVKMGNRPQRPNEMIQLGTAEQILTQPILTNGTNTSTSNSPSATPSFSPVTVASLAPTTNKSNNTASAAPSASPTSMPTLQPSGNPSSSPTRNPFPAPTNSPFPVPTPPSKKKHSVFLHVVTWLFFVGLLGFGGYECYLHRSTILFMTTRMFSEIVFRVKECCNRLFRRNARDETAREPATLNEILFEEDSQSLNQAELSERLLS